MAQFVTQFATQVETQLGLKLLLWNDRNSFLKKFLIFVFVSNRALITCNSHICLFALFFYIEHCIPAGKVRRYTAMHTATLRRLTE